MSRFTASGHDDKNGQIKKRIKAISLILNPKIQQLIVHVCTKFLFKILAETIPEKIVTQFFNVKM